MLLPCVMNHATTCDMSHHYVGEPEGGIPRLYKMSDSHHFRLADGFYVRVLVPRNDYEYAICQVYRGHIQMSSMLLNSSHNSYKE